MRLQIRNSLLDAGDKPACKNGTKKGKLRLLIIESY